MTKSLLFFCIVILGCNTNSNRNNRSKDRLEQFNKCPIGICQNNEVEYDSANIFFTKENLNKVGPITFLNYLKQFPCYELTIPSCRFPLNWIEKNDLKGLIYLLNDKTPCPKIHIQSLKSNSLNTDSGYIKSSTISQEVLRLLNGYYLNYFPCPILYDKDAIKLLIQQYKD